MRHLRSILLGTAALAFLTAGDLAAQRRGTSGGGSDTRGTPSGSGGRSASGGSSSRGSGGSAARPSSPGRSSGSVSRGGGSTTSTATPSGGRPTSGKIGAVRRTATRGTPTGDVVIIDRGVYLGGCWDCNYWGWYHGGWGWYHGGWWYPERPRYYDDEPENEDAGGQGYLPYPYAENDGTGSTFVQPHATRRNAFGAVSGQYFSDVGSTTTAGRFAIEGAYRQLRVDAEYGGYAEPLAGGTDRMSTLRFGVGWQPRLGTNGYMYAGVGARMVELDQGIDAGCLEGELGIQLLPVRPFGINVTGRLADMRWENQTDHFTLREMNTTGSIFLGRFEIQGGWHWLKLGTAPAFGGPVVGTRIWF